MKKQEIKDFYEQNKSYTIAFIVVAVICLAGVWLVHDHTRNEPVYNDTDSVLDTIEVRAESIADGLDRVQERNRKSQKAVSGAAEAVRDSREQAESIAGSIGRAERRLDEAIQRSGRIENIIHDIEAANR